MALYNIFNLVELCKTCKWRSPFRLDCDDSFIAYHIFNHIKKSGGEETLLTVKDPSQIDIILDNIILDYTNFINSIEEDIKKQWNNIIHRSDNRPLDPFDLERFLNTISNVQKENPLLGLHVTNYKAFIYGKDITDKY